MFRIHKIFSTIIHSYLPALIFGLTVWYDYLVQTFGAEDFLIWRRFCYAFLCATGLFLMSVNRSKPFFLLLWIFGIYVFFQHLPLTGEGDFRLNAAFNLLFLLFPLNALFLHHRAENRLFRRENNYLLWGILTQGYLIEHITFLPPECLSFLFWAGCVIWCCVLFYLLICVSQTGGMRESFVFYALISVLMAFLSYDAPMVMSLYMMSAAFCLLFGTLAEYLYAMFRDPLTGVYSRNCYEWRSQKSFPLKYTLGLICVDNYDKLLKAFGPRKTSRLVWLMTDILKNVQDRASIYRMDEDEFVLIFYEDDKKQAYEYLEALRRRIAGTVFELQHNLKIKVTISAGVSEKKRSDINAEAVLQRVREAVQRAYKFTQNVTSKV